MVIVQYVDLGRLKMSEQIKASFNVNEKIWEDFKIYCIKKKLTMTEKLEEMIKEVLKNG